MISRIDLGWPHPRVIYDEFSPFIGWLTEGPTWGWGGQGWISYDRCTCGVATVSRDGQHWRAVRVA